MRREQTESKAAQIVSVNDVTCAHVWFKHQIGFDSRNWVTYSSLD